MQKLLQKTTRMLYLLLLACCFFVQSTFALTLQITQMVSNATTADTATTQYAYVTDQSVYFYDVNSKYSWAFHEIDYLATLGVVNGTGSYLFAPEEQISRADFVLMLYRAYDMKQYATGTNFPDVPANAYYYEAVLAAKNLGIATGSGGNFQPNEKVSREDAMVFLLRTIKRTGLVPRAASLLTFNDSQKVSDYAKESVERLVGAGLISGDAQGNLSPQTNVTRVQMAVMVYRGLMLEDGEQGVHYVAHPERMNICVGDMIYPSVIVSNYDNKKTYQGLMEIGSLIEQDGKHLVTLGDTVAIDQQIAYANGKIITQGQEWPLASDAVAVQVAPYAALPSFVSTGGVYAYGLAQVNAQGEIDVIYYARAS